MLGPNEKTIIEALEQIKAQLLAGASSDSAISDAAEGYDLPGLLLTNRAVRLFGSLETYALRHAETALQVEVSSVARRHSEEQKEIETAKKLVHGEVSRLQWQYDAKVEPAFQGREFRLDSSIYVFLLRVPANRIWSIYAIDVMSKNTVRLSRSSWRRIEQQLVSDLPPDH